SLAGLARGEVRAQLAELVQANLLTEDVPGRYALHDLLRAYAAEQADREDQPDERHAARQRWYDHYLYSAQAHARRLYGPWCDLPLPPVPAGVAPEEPADAAAASAWFGTEHRVLVAAVARATTDGFEAHTWRLAWTLTLSLDSRNLWHEYALLLDTALVAADRIADPAGVAYSHQGLGRALAALGRYPDASTHLARAQESFARLGDRAAEGNVHIALGFLRYRTGDFDAAVREARLALELFRAAGHRSGQALALSNLGSALTELGEHAPALEYCQQAVDLRPSCASSCGG
ncbi:MAG TPA: tetratricopeptide repeat protein, partial [Rugosimonospora sp.]|nr:tetratricopeptide repeat protein [Rugosimonospora sp.]